jgi:hypothetical protein
VQKTLELPAVAFTKTNYAASMVRFRVEITWKKYPGERFALFPLGHHYGQIQLESVAQFRQR